MKHIIVGTNRPHSRSAEIALIVQKLFKDNGEFVDILNLQDCGLEEISATPFPKELPGKLKQAVQKTIESDGLIMIVPEYNGSYPGALKYFIDHWVYPDSFEFRPVTFIGLGGKFGGLRPVEHLQQVFGYRNGFVYPERVFLTDIFGILKDGQIQNPVLMKLLESQVTGFQKFVKGLQTVGLDANSRRAATQAKN
jgi:chromate reductase